MTSKEEGTETREVVKKNQSSGLNLTYNAGENLNDSLFWSLFPYSTFGELTKIKVNVG